MKKILLNTLCIGVFLAMVGCNEAENKESAVELDTPTKIANTDSCNLNEDLKRDLEEDLKFFKKANDGVPPSVKIGKRLKTRRMEAKACEIEITTKSGWREVKRLELYQKRPNIYSVRIVDKVK